MNQKKLTEIGFNLMKCKNLEEAFEIGEQIIRTQLKDEKEEIQTVPLVDKKEKEIVVTPIKRIKRGLIAKQMCEFIENNNGAVALDMAKYCNVTANTIISNARKLILQGKIKKTKVKVSHCNRPVNYYTLTKKTGVIDYIEAKHERQINPNVLIAKGRA